MRRHRPNTRVPSQAGQNLQGRVAGGSVLSERHYTKLSSSPELSFRGRRGEHTDVRGAAAVDNGPSLLVAATFCAVLLTSGTPDVVPALAYQRDVRPTRVPRGTPEPLSKEIQPAESANSRAIGAAKGGECRHWVLPAAPPGGGRRDAIT